MEVEIVDTAAKDVTHLSNFGQFLKDFNQSAKSVLPAKSKKYDEVCVLLVRWEDDDLGTEAEIVELEKVFHGLYHYKTERYLIPSHDATTQLDDRLVDWRRANDNGGDNLLILYYGGHGMLDRQHGQASRSRWAANLKPGSASVVWSDLQGILQRAKSDVLFILDCCFAATASRGSAAKEGLWASNSELTTTGVNNNSFTRNLIAELRLLIHTRFNIVILHQRLMARYKKPGTHRLLTEPWYTYMGNETAPSIELIPRDTVSVSSSLEIPVTETLVLLAVRLKKLDTIPNTSAWQSWLHHSSPTDVDAVMALGKLQLRDLLRLEGCYRSHSDLIVMSMPICLWDRLPANAAYQFIAFVRSQNLVSTKPANPPKARSKQDEEWEITRERDELFQEFVKSLSHYRSVTQMVELRGKISRFLYLILMLFSLIQCVWPSHSSLLNGISGLAIYFVMRPQVISDVVGTYSFSAPKSANDPERYLILQDLAPKIRRTDAKAEDFLSFLGSISLAVSFISLYLSLLPYTKDDLIGYEMKTWYPTLDSSDTFGGGVFVLKFAIISVTVVIMIALVFRNWDNTSELLASSAMVSKHNPKRSQRY